MLQREMHAGQLAFELERSEEAAAQYRTALNRAQARDDADAIGDTGYDLAVAELRANAPDKALADAYDLTPEKVAGRISKWLSEGAKRG